MQLSTEEKSVEAPAIKGTAFLSAHADVNRLVEEGRLSRDDLELRLAADDLRILDEKVAPAAWYPIACYERLVELLADLEGAGSRETYLVGRGTRAAERLSAAGIYQQLDASIESWGPRVGRIIITLSSLMYSFTRWSFATGDRPGHFEIRVEDAADFPEASRFATQGFIEFVAQRTVGAPVRVRSRRPAPDLVIYCAEPA